MSYEVIKKAIDDGRNILITGSAGTGKSYMLNKLRQDFRNMTVTASTGAAAVNVGGVTIHSFAGIGYGNKPVDELMVGMHPVVLDRIKFCRILAIDEVSMLNAAILDLIDELFRHVRDMDIPFGGVQMVFIGDFMQLPPVEGNFAFKAIAWDEAKIEMFHLNKVWRQDDDEFLRILNDVRFGRMVSDDHTKLTQTRLNGRAVNLFARNAPADKHNTQELNKLPGKMWCFNAMDEGRQELLKSCITPQKLWIKENARVMLTVNLDTGLGLVNGAMGVVEKISTAEIKVRFDNGMSASLNQMCVARIESGNNVLASRYQYPLRLAWAISIHKSQGMTLDFVRVDMGGIFEYGQAYVALSRARCLSGLEVNNLNINDVKANPEAKNFYEGEFSNGIQAT